jgi:hypothetical protein
LICTTVTHLICIKFAIGYPPCCVGAESKREITVIAAIESALRQVARENGKPLLVVQKVFQLQMEAAYIDAVLMMLDGKLTWVSKHGEPPPRSLKAEIDRSHDDLVYLADAVIRACRKAATGLAE